MPHARFIAFPELGHWPQISAPEVFRKVLDWLWETRAEAKRISAIVVPRKRATASFGPDAVGGTAARITRRFRGRPAQFQSACPIRRRSVLTQINRPIQRRSGGLSYGAAYSGPIGVIIASATSLSPGRHHAVAFHYGLRYCASIRRHAVPEHPRIALDPDVMVGKPVIRGTRITVELIIGLLAQGWTEQEILAAYPHLTRDDILACLAYAQELVSSEKVYPTAAA
jgi:uncharacterized protein (DUF433 family)